MRNEIFNILLTVDSADQKALIGVAATMFFTSVEGFDMVVKIVGGILGLVFLTLGIIHRLLQIKEVKNKMKEGEK